MTDDRTLCPKCGRMFCAGYRREGVCTADMTFTGEPTSDGDNAAAYLRVWYEAHRESFFERHRPGLFGPGPDRHGPQADNLMLGLIIEVGRIDTERRRQADERMKAVARR